MHTGPHTSSLWIPTAPVPFITTFFDTQVGRLPRFLLVYIRSSPSRTSSTFSPDMFERLRGLYRGF